MASIWLSAVIVIPILKGIYGADSVTQTDGSVFISQGDPVFLNCTYQISGFPYLFWYVQNSNQPPRLFLRDPGSEDSDEGIRNGFNATHDKKHKSFQLWKPSGEVSDSATYYCAVRDTVTRTGRELSKNRAGSVWSRGEAGTGVGAGGKRGEV
ncbi:unnamed protein product [Natator depressus]